MSDVKSIAGLSHSIVVAVLRELKDRGGFDHWWDDIDPETQDEIKRHLIKVVKEKIAE